MALEHLMTGLNRKYLENRKNAEIAGKSVKIAVFDVQNAKTRAFFKIST